MILTRRHFVTAAAASLLIPHASHAAPGPRWYDEGQGLAASGRDVVAYFSLSSRANGVVGSSDYTTTYKDIRFQFSNAENLETFLADPEKYIPRFGGHCAYAMARGYFASGDPDAWTVHDGELFLNVSKLIRARWLITKNSEIANGKKNWEGFYPGQV